MKKIKNIIWNYQHIVNTYLRHFYSTFKMPFNKGMTRLSPNRQLIEICGKDAKKFLQNMISSNVPVEGPDMGIFSSFLQPQGRILCDVFIYPVTHNSLWKKRRGEIYDENEQAFFIECDIQSTENLMNHLKHHKLRSKWALRLINHNEWNVWSSWGIEIPENYEKKEIIGCYDRRAPGLGRRDILPSNTKPAFELEEMPIENYKLRRYLFGIPEGPDEIFENIAFPIESCIDYMGGIDFHKGCYIGQELTTRIHHTGTVRKRIVPISLYDFNMPPPSILEYTPCEKISTPLKSSIIVREDARQKSIGKFCSGIGNIGLGLVRLDSVFNEHEKYKKCLINYIDNNNNNLTIGVKAFQPWWWPQQHTNHC